MPSLHEATYHRLRAYVQHGHTHVRLPLDPTTPRAHGMVVVVVWPAPGERATHASFRFSVPKPQLDRSLCLLALISLRPDPDKSHSLISRWTVALDRSYRVAPSGSDFEVHLFAAVSRADRRLAMNGTGQQQQVDERRDV
jgi:hypothetical protein